ncbi:Protein CBG26874 [Caenorhabditis briggsae]|uniref:Protein CBG26874 n=1 Tax=Caenorhabditis briggsae TaxID=6238 RepID=B6II74_CAEBR|nr:Protein CBG26874 [Caenorhabditis briggsae]CAR99604.1 Protein CBG26874 [Caenorhabditis briggsae]
MFLLGSHTNTTTLTPQLRPSGVGLAESAVGRGR